MGRYPFTENVGAFLKLGAISWNGEAESYSGPFVTEADVDGTDFAFGSGLRYLFNNNIQLTGDWSYFGLDIAPISYINLGIGYHF